MYRNKILQPGRVSIISGHLGVKKMTEKLLNGFHWPGVRGDIIRYCRSCDVCQRTFPKGKVSKIPIGEMPLIAPRYPEDLPLKRIDTETVAEAMLEIFSLVGFPREILTDLGKQFISDCMHEVCRLASISHLTTTPFHV